MNYVCVVGLSITAKHVGIASGLWVMVQYNIIKFRVKKCLWHCSHFIVSSGKEKENKWVLSFILILWVHFWWQTVSSSSCSDGECLVVDRGELCHWYGQCWGRWRAQALSTKIVVVHCIFVVVFVGLSVAAKHAGVAGGAWVAVCGGDGRAWCDSWWRGGRISEWTFPQHWTSGRLHSFIAADYWLCYFFVSLSCFKG